MKYEKEKYFISYDAIDQQIIFEGNMRPYTTLEFEDITNFVNDILNKVKGIIKINLRKLRYINSFALRLIIEIIKSIVKTQKLNLKIIGSNVITWEQKVLPNLQQVFKNVEFKFYDQNFYGSQIIIEDVDFIPLLKNQTQLLWPLEKNILKKHGLSSGMKVADICCGCGDVALLIAREMNPNFIMGVDHSIPSIEYAINSQKDFNINNAEFHLGDATALMIENEIFDFVLCRLSIQIFSQPEQILKELYRITKPGGRIYLLGEDYDLIIGYPNQKEIRKVYDNAGKYGTDMGMDLYNGKKIYTILKDLKLTNIKIDHMVVNTNYSDRNLFSEMIKSWRFFSSYTIGDKLGIAKNEQDELLKGYDAQLRTIKHPHGYTTWTVIGGSGEKK